MATPDSYRLYILYSNSNITRHRQCFILINYIYRSICEKFNVGRATALKSVRRVVKALSDFALVFKWPNEKKAIEISNGFMLISSFPNIIRVIDGTHINICTPHNDPECYVNRKCHHSIHLQVLYYQLHEERCSTPHITLFFLKNNL